MDPSCLTKTRSELRLIGALYVLSKRSTVDHYGQLCTSGRVYVNVKEGSEVQKGLGVGTVTKNISSCRRTRCMSNTVKVRTSK